VWEDCGAGPNRVRVPTRKVFGSVEGPSQRVPIPASGASSSSKTAPKTDEEDEEEDEEEKEEETPAGFPTTL